MSLTEDFMLLHQELPWVTTALVFIFGAVVGSFLNVCIYRIPAGRSVVSPGSTCGCGKPIAWHDNLPILSWLHLRGRARCCGQPFSFRYPAVEALTGALFAGLWLLFPPAVAAVLMVFAALLVAATFIDIDHMIIPDRFSVGGAATGILCAALVPALHGANPDALLGGRIEAVFTALLGALIASGLTLWVMILAELAFRKEGMGFGDVKLMGAIGAFCGWEGGVFALFGGSLLGTAAFLVMAIVQRLRPSESQSAPQAPLPTQEGMPEQPEGPIGFGHYLPFGPALAGGALLYLLLAKPWFDAHLDEIHALLFLAW